MQEKQPEADGTSADKIEELKQRYIAFKQRRNWRDINEISAEINEIYGEAENLGLIKE